MNPFNSGFAMNERSIISNSTVATTATMPMNTIMRVRKICGRVIGECCSETGSGAAVPSTVDQDDIDSFGRTTLRLLAHCAHVYTGAAYAPLDEKGADRQGTRQRQPPRRTLGCGRIARKGLYPHPQRVAAQQLPGKDPQIFP